MSSTSVNVQFLSITLHVPSTLPSPNPLFWCPWRCFATCCVLYSPIGMGPASLSGLDHLHHPRLSKVPRDHSSLHLAGVVVEDGFPFFAIHEKLKLYLDIWWCTYYTVFLLSEWCVVSSLLYTLHTEFFIFNLALSVAGPRFYPSREASSRNPWTHAS